LNKNNISTWFLPKKTKGGIWSIGLLIGTLLIFIIPLSFIRVISNPWYIGLMVTFIALMGLIFGVAVHGFYTLKYLVTDTSLVIRWSFIKKIIPLRDISFISSVTKEHLQGIRSFGVGIPGYLVGRFQLKLNGEFIATRLYATDIDNLIILRTSDNKTYGITPELKDEFMTFIQSKESSLRKTEMDTSEPVPVTENELKKSRIILTALFLICLILPIATFIYFLIIYQRLPETGVPLHWGPGGIVDRWGNRSELLTMISIFTGVEVLISIPVYIWMIRSDLGKVRIGKIIMLFPLIINLVFSVITIVILEATLNYF
jgi:hypothetical protein